MSFDLNSKHRPCLSILMTAYNHEKFIGEAIESCLTQTFTDFELIVINDGSTDQTASVIASYQDPRLVVIHQENGGPSLATNAGMTAARGEYLVLMSGDDVCEPDRLQKQWEASRAHPDAIIFSHVSLIGQDGAPAEDATWISVPFNQPPMSRSEIALRLLSKGNFLCAPSAFMPKARLIEAGGFNPALFQLQDFALWLRLLLRCEFVTVTEPLLRYRVHGSNLSRPTEAAHNATLHELQLIFRDFCASLDAAQFHDLFGMPETPLVPGTETFHLLEKAFFFRQFGQPPLKRVANEMMFEAMASEEGRILAKQYFDYTPATLWNDLKADGLALSGENPRHLAYQMHHLQYRLNRGPVKLAERLLGFAEGRPILRGLLKFSVPGLKASFRLARGARGTMLRMREKLRRYGPSFSGWYASAALARMIGSKADHPLLEKANRHFPYHPVANLRRAAHFRSANMPERALPLYKRAFLTEATLFLQHPVVLDQFLAMLQVSGRTFEVRYVEQRLAAMGHKVNPSLPAREDTLPAWAPPPVRLGLFRSVLTVKPLDRWLDEGTDSQTLFEQEDPYEFQLPRVYGEPESPETYRLEVPPSFVATLRDVAVTPGFGVVSDARQEWIVYEPAAHPKFGQLSGLRGRLSAVPGFPEAIRLSMEVDRSVHVPEAVLLSGRCSANYFHWLIEYLPRLLEIELHGGLQGVPLIVSEQMPFQHYEALFAILKADHPVVYMDDRTVTAVDVLHVPSFSTYVPDDFDSPFWKAGGVSRRHIAFLRDKVLGAEVRPNSEGAGSKRIFVSRSRNAGRSMANEVAIVDACRKAGFDVIYPELMSFQEQVACFSEADVIMGPTGAAFANVIFCKRGTTIYGLTSERNKTFCNFANLATSVGCDFINVTGPNNRPRSDFANEEEFAHSSFTVPFDKIESILASLPRR